MDGEFGLHSMDEFMDTASVDEFGDTSVGESVDTASVDTASVDDADTTVAERFRDRKDSVDEELDFTALQTFYPGKKLLENSICTA